MNKYNQSGQTLLVIILLATVLLTIGLSVSQTTTQEQKITKLEQDAKQAYAAAEAGIDAAIKQKTTVSIGSLGLGNGISGTATVQTTTANGFTTPTMKKDEQYTFYVSDYDIAANSFTGESFDDSMNITVNTPGGVYVCGPTTSMALELTFVLTNSTNSSSTVSDRRIIDPCLLTGATNGTISFGQAFTPNASSMMIMRVIAPSATFSGISLNINKASGNWPLQGQTIVSSAQTQTGASKKLQLFQSYPQLPSEFFVTRF
ncbi:hypothetical protein A3D80_01145 [Candidatus Roizmanbacteria bacterium RIFCSPHIGHO2_02_FULL_40_13b]|uniref:Type 4 fimbrial biogenesis protein PilX N-terminal domain-containing protein n=1 Tax=Candidatus Roizmanbacteria bacterium RIFCSPHIGHO2_01_FULL_39_24 TaxID=1802032 RepID=A0A1F7GJ23_9BACT|nr:MAG: hypothetical protein A2799_03040 [Candidatus Roizmanbacteria bacterium RIFCSPHIGHO2_01_FULL_39_24]OGK26331.1 MAG: hypothetical protein A3D80_01145 [Candidatus Roizmanbacteria bacterium RIFCSPHIGHO2_02_FULL_40_13b]OGK50144.1 MAG: hypothetical protein A3A56_00490 [Candidatus Roizmanbacteria bacterium RIFCSPLOWO2_01_FULL_40_32]OGK56814.1 MAG: hypothetical protein A3H83_03695 [Candidatus Roizmanbacteria bacterium RIFCSPLOWO2_02_FULL_39_8]